jgi:hypothetical protein
VCRFVVGVQFEVLGVIPRQIKWLSGMLRLLPTTLQSSTPRVSATGGAAGAMAEAETSGDWVDNLLRRKDTVLLSDFLALQNPQGPSGERIDTLESKRILI